MITKNRSPQKAVGSYNQEIYRPKKPGKARVPKSPIPVNDQMRVLTGLGGKVFEGVHGSCNKHFPHKERMHQGSTADFGTCACLKRMLTVSIRMHNKPGTVTSVATPGMLAKHFCSQNKYKTQDNNDLETARLLSNSFSHGITKKYSQNPVSRNVLEAPVLRTDSLWLVAAKGNKALPLPTLRG